MSTSTTTLSPARDVDVSVGQRRATTFRPASSSIIAADLFSFFFFFVSVWVETLEGEESRQKRWPTEEETGPRPTFSIIHFHSPSISAFASERISTPRKRFSVRCRRGGRRQVSAVDVATWESSVRRNGVAAWCKRVRHFLWSAGVRAESRCAASRSLGGNKWGKWGRRKGLARPLQQLRSRERKKYRKKVFSPHEKEEKRNARDRRERGRSTAPENHHEGHTRFFLFLRRRRRRKARGSGRGRSNNSSNRRRCGKKRPKRGNCAVLPQLLQISAVDGAEMRWRENIAGS